MVASEDVSAEMDVANCLVHAMELPKWANALILVLLVQPSSAAVGESFQSYSTLGSYSLIISFSSGKFFVFMREGG